MMISPTVLSTTRRQQEADAKAAEFRAVVKSPGGGVANGAMDVSFDDTDDDMDILPSMTASPRK